MLAHHLACLLRQGHVFSLPGLEDNRFHATGAQRALTVPSSAFLVPPASSPYLDANVGIGPQATQLPDCSTLQLCQTNQTWGGEPSELLVAEGCKKAVGVKLLHVIDETFYSIPIDGANFWYLVRLSSWASAAWYKPVKENGVRWRRASRLSNA